MLSENKWFGRQSVKHLPALDEGNVDAVKVSVSKFTDYTSLTAPHVSFVQAVFTGENFRYKLQADNAVLLFDHGCLMGRIFFEGHFYALPPIDEDAQGHPYLRGLPIAQRSAIAEFCSLPKGILLFYFTLLKQVFEGRELRGQWHRDTTGRNMEESIPQPIRPWLEAVGWPYASTVEAASGCSAS